MSRLQLTSRSDMPANAPAPVASIRIRPEVSPPYFARRITRRTAIVWILGLVPLLPWAVGCGSSNWFRNGLLDPKQIGNFTTPVRLEIREYVSLLEEPLGVEGAEEPTPEDLVVRYEELPIGPGDIIRISIFELLAPTMNTEQQIQVRMSGYETLPVIGPVKVVGLTPRELELDLKERIREADILDDADVQVSVLRSEGMQFTVVGQVRQPGNFPLPRPDYRLSNLLGAVGGVPDQAATIIVIREGARPGNLTSSISPAQARPPWEEEIDDPSSVLSMSDVSDRPAPASSHPAPDRPKSGATESEIDELRILEGEPEGEPPLPDYDPESGEWVIKGVESSSQSSTAPTDERDKPTDKDPQAGRETEELADPEVLPGSGKADEHPQEGPLQAPRGDDEEDLVPSVRKIEIPVKDLLAGDPRYNIVIRPYDLITVPLDYLGEYYMGGNVGRPGAYALTGRRITVKQAVVAAGGLGELAWPSRADLIRRISKDEEQNIQVDLDAIFAGKAPDFYLRPHDVLNVGSHPVATFLAVFRNAFRLSYGFGFVYDRNFADSDTFQAREQVKNRRRIEAQTRGIPF